MRGLRPAEYHKSIFEIDLDKLRRMGKRAIMLDLDNTLVRWNDPTPTPALLDWLAEARAHGLQPCIVSNNRGARVREFASRAGVPFIGRAGKPRVKGFAEAMQRLGVTPGETVVVGDQIFTDVLGGNRAGAYTILVVPIDRREFIGTRLVRIIERRVLSYLQRRGLLTEK
ncbi:YqeG family HAD IIIA-type phosphatase [Symbiobacterium terraclitae]|uniref:YqeG family HAD IIIA-type phosphatase n=1 Tax=Symbiobacterium terraclitae TaxID=557451 RepID=UPI0035B54F1A